MARNPSWTREEEIVALDCYFKIYYEGGNEQELIQEVSDLLRRMPNSKNACDAVTFRNCNGVKLHMGNFKSLDPAYEGIGMTRVGQQAVATWNEFENDRKRLAEEADRLRSTYSSEDSL